MTTCHNHAWRSVSRFPGSCKYRASTASMWAYADVLPETRWNQCCQSGTKMFKQHSYGYSGYGRCYGFLWWKFKRSYSPHVSLSCHARGVRARIWALPSWDADAHGHPKGRDDFHTSQNSNIINESNHIKIQNKCQPYPAWIAWHRRELPAAELQQIQREIEKSVERLIGKRPAVRSIRKRCDL